ncbi:glycoside hydrolase family 19 protein [Nocardia miyunensis]|uniref:glycoside hydrolase family 19 protein n=1 Tax=Nocardia miyunensis TaxID=282684 RepID=UPI000A9B9334|nr:glycoside hydrolase family 19 protein [Nocardia miyunensis]
MTPPRSVLVTWRALEAADRMRAEFGRHIGDLETLSAAVRTECHRLDGDGWQGAAFDAMLASVEAAHRHDRMLCDHAEGLCAAGAQALSDLHYTATALLDYVADAEAAGCAVADDWTVTAGSSAAAEWSEVIAEAVAAVDRAEERGRQAVLAVEHEMRHLAAVFGRDANSGDPRDDRKSVPQPRPSDRDGATKPSEESDRVVGPVAQSAAATVPAAAARTDPAINSTPAVNSAPAVDSALAQSFPMPEVQESGGVLPAPGFADANTARAAVSPPLPPRQSAQPPGITAEQLTAIMPNLPMDRARQYLPALDAAMREGNITTPVRRAAFLAQLAHESGEFRYFEELGDDAYFHQYDPGQPNTAAGNTQPGDGPRYHGRGPIQLTGRANYRAAGQALGLDLEGDPELAARPDIGFRIAQWYWTSRNINALADAGDFAAVTRAVNGGYNGLQAREAYYRRALEVLG